MLSNTILIACLLVIATTIAFITLQKSSTKTGIKQKSYQPSIVIAGPQNSGKTSFLTFLTTDSVRPTVVSQEPLSAANYDGSNVTLLDFPGHAKLRYELLEYLKTRAAFVKGLIYMVDSTIDPKKLTSTAELLVDIVSITESNCENGIDILIACNKSESFTARPPSKIRDALEKEMQKVIERRKKSLNEVKRKVNEEEDTENALDVLQSTNGFKFENLEGSVVAFEGSVSKKNITKWRKWIDEKI
ncbi:srp102p [Saccharomyces arboricola H-6]|uniref:Signal recognition particle receptor subunit beta n=1 Tax=Saccharomyces arboricola (strain H-6 / AS 2.3317 / CBS 10644) TaxID=1160507 RepID=J8Q026_SACAR|nr:srp102p [Saccharomyces arboricola H-6]